MPEGIFNSSFLHPHVQESFSLWGEGTQVASTQLSSSQNPPVHFFISIIPATRSTADSIKAITNPGRMYAASTPPLKHNAEIPIIVFAFFAHISNISFTAFSLKVYANNEIMTTIFIFLTSQHYGNSADFRKNSQIQLTSQLKRAIMSNVDR